jgi:hypothetical protein
MSYCGVVEVRSVEDALGAACGRAGEAWCTDCGTSLCSAHLERCGLCEETFCPSCPSFHQNDEHPKQAQGDRHRSQKRKTA